MGEEGGFWGNHMVFRGDGRGWRILVESHGFQG